MKTRREFLKIAGSATALTLTGGVPGLLASAMAAGRDKELRILCWEGYNSDQVLDPFRKKFAAKVQAESGTSDPDMINKLRAGEVNVWDLINVNQPWARGQLFPEKLIKPLDKERFAPYFEKMLPYFQGPFKTAIGPKGELLGMAQRFGPFSFVVNTDKISKDLAEDQGYQLFLDPKMKGRYGVLTYDNWNIAHMCLTAGFDPYRKHTPAEFEAFTKVAHQIFDGAKLMTDDLVSMNTALINGEIDAYFTGGTYTSSPARLDGEDQVLAITPKSGPVDGKGGVVWIELTSLVNNPDASPLAPEFLAYVQEPEVSHRVAFAEGTYNPVAQMGNPDVLALFSKEELKAIQWDTLEEEMARSIDFGINPDYEAMFKIYKAAKRS
ncbi:MAG: PotD/PotF family extracellular solute-binding protein [Desulfovibrionaceae bacterium]